MIPGDIQIYSTSLPPQPNPNPRARAAVTTGGAYCETIEEARPSSRGRRSQCQGCRT